jgi:hypothetical protein
MIAKNTYLAEFTAVDTKVKEAANELNLWERFEQLSIELEELGTIDDVLKLKPNMNCNEEDIGYPPLEPYIEDFTSEDIGLIQFIKLGANEKLRTQYAQQYQELWDYFYIPVILEDYRATLMKENDYKSKEFKEFVKGHTQFQNLRDEMKSIPRVCANFLLELKQCPPEQIPAPTENESYGITTEGIRLLELVKSISDKIDWYCPE